MNESQTPQDNRSTRDLVNTVLSSNDEGAVDSVYWNAMSELHRGGTREVFEAARSLCESACPLEQRVGCGILAQLGAPEMPFASASFPLVASVLRNSANLDTLANALCALGWLRDLRGVDLVLPYLNHADSDIRYWVTQALTALHDDNRSIKGLIRLTADPSVEVRDWATFGLGSMTERDTPAIRNALVACLDDPDAIVRGEALVGLAKRQDERVVKPLLRELEAGTYNVGISDYAREALDALKNSESYPELMKWKTND
jgi:HEAT repeat protein